MKLSNSMTTGIVDTTYTEIGDADGKRVKILKNILINSSSEYSVYHVDDATEVLNERQTDTSSPIFDATPLSIEEKLKKPEYIPADELLKKKTRQYCTTGSKSLDVLLDGGVETRAITEVVGAYGSGKSHFCHTIAVLCQLPIEKGGFDASTLYIDTEGAFRPYRLAEIAQSRGLNQRKVLDNVLHCRTFTVPHLEITIKSLDIYIKKYQVKLLIVDSIIALYRLEFIGRKNLLERQQRLNLLIHELHDLAEINNLAVVITNQIQSTSTASRSANRPAGGNVLAHGSTYRIEFKRSGNEWIATIVDSPCHPPSEAKFTITETGITDIEEEEKRR